MARLNEMGPSASRIAGNPTGLCAVAPAAGGAPLAVGLSGSVGLCRGSVGAVARREAHHERRAQERAHVEESVDVEACLRDESATTVIVRVAASNIVLRAVTCR